MKAITNHAHSYVNRAFDRENMMQGLLSEDPDIVVSISIVSKGETILTGALTPDGVEIDEEPPPVVSDTKASGRKKKTEKE